MYTFGYFAVHNNLPRRALQMTMEGKLVWALNDGRLTAQYVEEQS